MAYDVPLIPQSTGMGCWAASIAMILSWKNNASFDPALIAANHGGISYVPSLQSGLDPNDRYILERNGFALEAPVCYTPAGIADLLASSGPLWVAGLKPSDKRGGNPYPHIRVVTGLTGGIVSFNDPEPINQGSKRTARFETFFGQMESLGARERAEPNPVYVAYLAD